MDSSWLERAYKFAVTDYEEWIRPPHLAGNTGLSRYFDHGEGPVPEILGNPKDYYRGVARYMLTHHEGDEASYVVHLGKNPDAPHAGPIFEFECDPASQPNSHPGLPGRSRRAYRELLRGRPHHARIGI